MFAGNWEIDPKGGAETESNYRGGCSVLFCTTTDGNESNWLEGGKLIKQNPSVPLYSRS